MIRFFALVGIAASGFAVPGLAAQLTRDTAQQVDRVFAAIDRTDSPGCVLGLDRGGQPLHRRGYGMASLEFGVPLEERSVLESGSVAKQFTAGAIVHLALNGRLGLDDPVTRYLKELPDYGAPITIRMLLNHTSGIRDMWTLFGLAGQQMGTVLFGMDRALQMVWRQRELNFAPNSQYLYSNSGYLLLAEIVRRVSGTPLAEYSRDTFFAPLGMRQTQWRDDWNRVVPHRATAYSSTKDGFRVEMPFMNVYGAGGLLTTVSDLLVWNEELSHPRIGGSAWADSLVHRARLNNGRELEYALGLIVGSYRRERTVSHTGATGGYRTYLARFPERGISIAVLCNYASADPETFGRRVVDIFLGPKEPAAAATALSSSTPIPSLTTYVGRFRNPESEAVISFTARDGKLIVELAAGLPLDPAGVDRFVLPASGLTVRFEDLISGTAARAMVFEPQGDSTRYQRVTPPRSTAAELAGYAGTYHSDELGVVYQVTTKDSMLVLQIAGGPPLPLARLAIDSFGEATGLGLRFTRRGNRVNGFLLFAGRVQNLRFTRGSNP